MVCRAPIYFCFNRSSDTLPPSHSFSFSHSGLASDSRFRGTVTPDLEGGGASDRSPPPGSHQPGLAPAEGWLGTRLAQNILTYFQIAYIPLKHKTSLIRTTAASTGCCIWSRTGCCGTAWATPSTPCAGSPLSNACCRAHVESPFLAVLSLQLVWFFASFSKLVFDCHYIAV